MSIGRRGEQIAEDFLKKKEYKIIERNFKRFGGEIDIIASKDSSIIVIEVKSKSEYSQFYPEENINDKKLKKILNTFDIFLSENPEYEKFDPQIDVMIVELGENPKINHFKNLLID